ncbi:MAG: hypothetical protein ACKPA9_06480, partial [Microcystis sp.]
MNIDNVPRANRTRYILFEKWYYRGLVVSRLSAVASSFFCLWYLLRKICYDVGTCLVFGKNN